MDLVEYRNAGRQVAEWNVFCTIKQAFNIMGKMLTSTHKVSTQFLIIFVCSYRIFDTMWIKFYLLVFAVLCCCFQEAPLLFKMNTQYTMKQWKLHNEQSPLLYNCTLHFNDNKLAINMLIQHIQYSQNITGNDVTIHMQINRKLCKVGRLIKDKKKNTLLERLSSRTPQQKPKTMNYGE